MTNVRKEKFQREIDPENQKYIKNSIMLPLNIGS